MNVTSDFSSFDQVRARPFEIQWYQITQKNKNLRENERMYFVRSENAA